MEEAGTPSPARLHRACTVLGNLNVEEGGADSGGQSWRRGTRQPWMRVSSFPDLATQGLLKPAREEGSSASPAWLPRA